MDINVILEDLPAHCAQRWPDPTLAQKHYQTAAALADKIHAIKSSLKSKKAEKQECARGFGTLKASGADLTVAKMRMQEISSELERLEAQRKDLETQIIVLLTAPQAIARVAPLRFDNYTIAFDGVINVVEAQDCDSTAWDDYVNAHPQSSLYHLYIWRDVIAQSFQHAAIYLIARDTLGGMHGVLPLVRLTSRLFGDFAVSMPFFNYGGPLADNADIANQLLSCAEAIAEQQQLDHLEIRATQNLNDWPVRTDKVSMIRALPSSGAALDEEIGAKVRAQINRAHQESPAVAIGHLDLLDEFYHVFAVNMRDLGTPVYGKQFFRNILAALPQQSHLVVIRLQGRPVAAAFLLGYREMMEIPWASTLRSVNSLNINMALYRAVLGFCIERKYQFFDFGRSTQNSGTYRFKKQWGAVPVQHYWHYWLRSGGELPALKPDSPKFKLVIACWQRTPVFVTRLIGPYIVKNLP